MIRTYKELRRLKTFEDRYNYLRLIGIVGESTFGYDRYLNQRLYTSAKWKRSKDNVIIRDNGCDLGVEDYKIYDKILIHHMNPLTPDIIENDDDLIYDPEFLICTAFETHNAIHYGKEESRTPFLKIRTRNDTCPWLK